MAAKTPKSETQNTPLDQTPAPQDQTLQALADMIPEAFRDGVIDPDALLAHLGLVPVHDEAERPYAFLWSGLTRARAEATSPTTATLHPDLDVSVDWDSTGNVAIEGDNLQVLKLLLNGYRGRFKLIYIDPPYNTGATFAYSDKYAVPESEWLTASGQLDAEGNALTARIENGGRKHAPWLTMMLPRLIVARHLLARDGAIVAAIDDNEAHHLRLLMDGVFGEANFAGSFVWEGGRKNDARFVSVGHDYMLCYARDKAHLVSRDVRWKARKHGLEDVYGEVERLRDEHGDDYTAISSELRAWYGTLKRGHPSLSNRHYEYVDERGIFYLGDISSPNYRENLVYEWKGYDPPDNGWRYELEEMKRRDADGRIHYPADGDSRPNVKRYLHESEDTVPGSVFYKDRRAAARALRDLMGAKRTFDFPKDTTVLAWLIEAITDPDDLILDFFAGSGSTAQAVWEQNVNDSGRRRWVMVQAAEETDAKSGGRKAGYETVSALMLERLARASAAIKEREEGEHDLGYRVFRAIESTLERDAPLVNEGDLDGQTYIDSAVEADGTPTLKEGVHAVDAVWEIILKATRVDLSVTVSERAVDDGLTVFDVREGASESPGLVVCLAQSVTLDQFEVIGVNPSDTFVCIKEAMDDGTAVTVGQRCRLLIVERVRSDVAL